IPAVFEATGLKLLLNHHQPLLADQGSSGLQERVERSMGRANVELATIQANEVAPLGCIADSFNESLEGGSLRQELGFQTFAISRSLLDDLANLGVPCPIQEGVDERLRIVPCVQASGLLVLGTDVPFQQNLAILAPIIAGHEVGQAPKLQAGRIGPNERPSIGHREQLTALPAVPSFAPIKDDRFTILLALPYGRNLGDIGVRMGGTASDRTVGIYRAVNLAVTFNLEPRLIPLSQLREPLLDHQIFGEELAWR